MAGVYSERLAYQSGAGAVAAWIPAGYRAVVRSILVTHGGSTTADGYVTGGPVTLWIGSYQALKQSQQYDMRGVLYGGEKLELYSSGAELSLSVHGYLFADPTMADGPLMEQEDQDAAAVLPASLGGS